MKALVIDLPWGTSLAELSSHATWLKVTFFSQGVIST
jgi:hypothetical protein